jgi:hypothetical protein
MAQRDRRRRSRCARSLLKRTRALFGLALKASA